MTVRGGTQTHRTRRSPLRRPPVGPSHANAEAFARLVSLLASATAMPLNLPHFPPAQAGIGVLTPPPTTSRSWTIGLSTGPLVVQPDVVRCTDSGSCTPVAVDALLGGRAMTAPGLVDLLASLTDNLPLVQPLTVQAGPGELVSVTGEGWVGPIVTLTLTWCVPGKPCADNHRQLGSAPVAGNGTFTWSGLLPPDLPPGAADLAVNADDTARTDNANLNIPVSAADAAPDPSAPVQFVVDTQMYIPTSWRVPLRAIAGDAAARKSVV